MSAVSQVSFLKLHTHAHTHTFIHKDSTLLTLFALYLAFSHVIIHGDLSTLNIDLSTLNIESFLIHF